MSFLNSVVDTSPMGSSRKIGTLPFCAHSFEHYLRVLEKDEMKQRAKPKLGARTERL